MSVIFVLLFVISVLSLIIGLIQPKVFTKLLKSKANRKNVGLIFGSAIVILFVLIGMTGSKSESTTVKKEPTKTVVSATPQPESTKTNTPVPTPTPPQYIFDVPALVGKNIDEIRQTLGNPKDGDLAEPNAQQKELGTDEWDNTFSKDNEELLVTFNPNTRRVVDFFIGTSPEKQDRAKLLQIGNLQENASAYKIEYVKALKDPNSITGVKVMPN